MHDKCYSARYVIKSFILGNSPVYQSIGRREYKG